MGAAPRLEHPVPSRGGQTGCPQHPDVRPAAASPPRPQPRPGLGWPTPEERGEPAMEGAPAPPAGSLPRRRRAELRGSGRGPGVTEGCPAGPDSGRALCPLPSPHPVSPAGRWAAGLSRCILPLPLPSLAPRQPHPVVPPSIYGSLAPPAGLAGPFPGRAGPQWKVVEKCGQISDLQHSGKEFIAIV